MLTTKQIYDFVCDFYDTDISIKDRNDHIVRMRSYFYYLALKYSQDVTTSVTLKEFTKISQQGTVLNSIYSLSDLKKYDNRRYLELISLEDNFRKHFDIKDIKYTFDIDSNDVLFLKSVAKNYKRKFRNHQTKIHNLKHKIKRLEHNLKASKIENNKLKNLIL